MVMGGKAEVDMVDMNAERSFRIHAATDERKFDK